MNKKLIELALQEDIGVRDVTTSLTVNSSKKGRAEVIAKEECIVSGMEMFREVFVTLDPLVKFKTMCTDGKSVRNGEKIVEIYGSLASILTAERTALNFIQRLSGVATTTSKFAEAVKGTGAYVTDTRKTTPGWRSLEKAAVRAGGAVNHRFGLFDGILIKENHIMAAGGIKKAVKLAKENSHHLLKIEVETENLGEVKQALEAGADIIMLDNMSLDMMKKAVLLIDKRALVEASGNVNLSNIRDIAMTGVDFISVGAITHSAPSVDFSMRIK